MQFLRAARHPGWMRVLIAEDELRLADAIARGLRRQGMAVDLAPDGEQALIKGRGGRYDGPVLEPGLPGGHGGHACRTREPRGACARACRRGPTIIGPSRSGSPSWWPASKRWRAARRRAGRRCCTTVTWSSVRRAGG